MGKKGQTRMAMWLFLEMRNSGCRPDTSVYNALITAHLHTRDKSGLYPKLLGPDIFTFNGVMDAYGKNGMIKEMESIISRMKSNQCKPDIITFNSLIDAYGRKKEFDKMEQVFKSLLRSKEKPTLPTFNSLITNYANARLREKAEHVFKEMTDMELVKYLIRMLASGKEMGVSSLNAMLDVYCMNGLPKEANQLFEHARKAGVSPDSLTYKLLYKAYTKGNMKELLQKLLMHMDKDGIIPNKRFFLDALGAFGSLAANESLPVSKII
ncbi:tetratricopeptide repeat (TPR)-like superfamily protein [Actinidia rufa]|uniref:Tetratricopeptide repeat (TPR)-like superfamily protein n=1 Tax=Actinidia rufa TaxID=165716 RepID=A0A7J0EXH7_9ERIC|nr:tetratricopeptide repeat (TPR)-like superfamily protein [Actinidia rufa]